jgi:hypothetical protein
MSNASPEQKRKYEDELSSLGLTPSAGMTRKTSDRDDDLRGIEQQGYRVRPPESIRSSFDKFRKALSEIKKP